MTNNNNDEMSLYGLVPESIKEEWLMKRATGEAEDHPEIFNENMEKILLEYLQKRGVRGKDNRMDERRCSKIG